jgi:hypothetical protein
MQREITPTAARAGAISGRVFLVLVSSFLGAVVALGLCWGLFLR